MDLGLVAKPTTALLWAHGDWSNMQQKGGGQRHLYQTSEKPSMDHQTLFVELGKTTAAAVSSGQSAIAEDFSV